MKEYEKLYNEASGPMPDDLIGTWEVTVLSGRLPNLRCYGHVKVIKPKKGTLRGYNQVLRIFRLGRFRITYSIQCARFHYGKWQFFDKVKKVNNDLLIGQYIFMTDFGRPETGGYFKMRRKD